MYIKKIKKRPLHSKTRYRPFQKSKSGAKPNDWGLTSFPDIDPNERDI